MDIEKSDSNTMLIKKRESGREIFISMWIIMKIYIRVTLKHIMKVC